MVMYDENGEVVPEIEQDVFEALQAEMPDLVSGTELLLSDLRCAESCETQADFRQNILSALEKLEELRSELQVALKEFKVQS